MSTIDFIIYIQHKEFLLNIIEKVYQNKEMVSNLLNNYLDCTLDKSWKLYCSRHWLFTKYEN